MDIDATTGRIFIFMVQQDGSWGTPAGDTMTSTLEGIAENLPAQPAN